MPKERCPLCGKEVSILFDMKEHQRSTSCKAMQNFKKVYDNGWRPLLPKFAGIITTMSLPVRTVSVPERAIQDLLHTDESIHDFIGFRRWDKLEHDKLAVISFTEGWIAEILEAADKQSVQNSMQALLMDSPTVTIGPSTRALLKHLLANKEDRPIFVAALRLGGIKRACEMLWEQQKAIRLNSTK